MPRARAVCKIPVVEAVESAGPERLRRERETLGDAMATEVEAQITGNVWKIEKAVGDRVEEEDVILIIESMKMEIPVEAPKSGTVSEILVSEGDSVAEGDILVRLSG